MVQKSLRSFAESESTKGRIGRETTTASASLTIVTYHKQRTVHQISASHVEPMWTPLLIATKVVQADCGEQRSVHIVRSAMAVGNRTEFVLKVGFEAILVEVVSHTEATWTHTHSFAESTGSRIIRCVA